MPGVRDVHEAEDDPEDQMLVRMAFEQSHLANVLTVVNDGVELVDYLKKILGERQAKPVRASLSPIFTFRWTRDQ